MLYIEEETKNNVRLGVKIFKNMACGIHLRVITGVFKLKASLLIYQKTISKIMINDKRLENSTVLPRGDEFVSI